MRLDCHTSLTPESPITAAGWAVQADSVVSYAIGIHAASSLMLKYTWLDMDNYCIFAGYVVAG